MELSPRATTTELMCHNYGAQVPRARAPQQEKPPQWEAYTRQLESSPHWLQLEKAYAQQRRPGEAENKLITLKKTTEQESKWKCSGWIMCKGAGVKEGACVM